MTTFLKGLVAFLKAIGIGLILASVLAGAAIAVVSQSAELGAYAFITAGVIAMPFFLVGGVMLGLPLTFMLRRLRMESRRVYLFAGAIIGYLTVPTYFFITDGDASGWALAVLGAIAGAQTGQTWWLSYRRHTSLDLPSQTS